MLTRVATEEDVRRACLAFPHVSERLSWVRPAWFTSALMARMWDDDVLTVKTEERDVLAGSQPDTFFWTPHHDRSANVVLVRLEKIAADELDEILREAYRLASAR